MRRMVDCLYAWSALTQNMVRWSSSRIHTSDLRKQVCFCFLLLLCDVLANSFLFRYTENTQYTVCKLYSLKCEYIQLQNNRIKFTEVNHKNSIKYDGIFTPIFQNFIDIQHICSIFYGKSWQNYFKMNKML